MQSDTNILEDHATTSIFTLKMEAVSWCQNPKDHNSNYRSLV